MRASIVVLFMLAACENHVTAPSGIALAPGREQAPAVGDLAAMDSAFAAETSPPVLRASTSELLSIAAGQSAAVADDERHAREARNGLERARWRLRENAVLLTRGAGLTADEGSPTRGGGTAKSPLQSLGGGY